MMISSIRIFLNMTSRALLIYIHKTVVRCCSKSYSKYAKSNCKYASILPGNYGLKTIVAGIRARAYNPVKLINYVVIFDTFINKSIDRHTGPNPQI